MSHSPEELSLKEIDRIKQERFEKYGRQWWAKEVTAKQYGNAVNGLETMRAVNELDQVGKMGKRLHDVKLPKKIGAVLGIGTALGATHATFDDTDDNLFSTGMKMAGYTAAVGTGVGLFSRWGGKDKAFDQKREVYWEMVKERYEEQARNAGKNFELKKGSLMERGMSEEKAVAHLKRKGTDNERTKLERAKRQVKDPIQLKEMVHEEKVVKTARNTMRFAKIGVGVTALGGIVSAAHSAKQSHDARQMVKAQEEKQYRDKKRKQEETARYGYGQVDMGNVVLQMFEERTGHHKMGNSKF